jgi:predicted nucleotidyltransferase
MRRASLSPSSARRIADHAATVLSADPRVRLVYFFGSGAAPSTSDVEDVDLAIWTDPPLALQELVRYGADLAASTGAAIDLVSLNDASIVLAWEVADSGCCLFARDPDLETEFVTRARARYWDFKPFRETQWRLAGERLAERLGGS